MDGPPTAATPTNSSERMWQAVGSEKVIPLGTAPVVGLSFFPEPFEDELLYSLMARVREMTGLSHYAVAKMFSGNSEAWVTVDLPLRLNQVATRIGPEITSVDDLLERHTLFAYYMGFFERPAYAHARNIATEGWTGVGVRHIKRQIPPIGHAKHLRFCVGCVNADKEISGIAGWRRLHQCPGVFVCHEHGTELLESNISSNRTKLLVSPSEDGAVAKRILNPFPISIALNIASSTAWLLAHPQKAVGFAVLRRRVRLLLSDNGWMGKAKNEVAAADLYQAILKHYGDECLQSLNINPNSRSWLTQTYTATHGSQKHPLHYLLLLDCLGLSSSNLFDARLDERTSIPERNREAGVIAATQPRAGLERRILKHRAKVKAFLSETPGASRTDVADKLAWTVDFLRNRDREWLDDVLPITARNGSRKVDWVRRDKEFARKVLQSAYEMLRAPERPRIISRTRLVRSVGFPRLVQCLPRLPTTSQALAASVEDEITFQRRQIHWAADHYVRVGSDSCTRAKLISGANRKKDLRPELLPEIDELVRRVNEGTVPE